MIVNPQTKGILLPPEGKEKPTNTIDISSGPFPSLEADKTVAKKHPNAKQRKRLGLPKPQHVPAKRHPGRYRRSK